MKTMSLYQELVPQPKYDYDGYRWRGIELGPNYNEDWKDKLKDYIPHKIGEEFELFLTKVKVKDVQLKHVRQHNNNNPLCWVTSVDVVRRMFY